MTAAARALQGLTLATLVFAACNRGSATAGTEMGGGGAVTIWTDSTELFMEYPPLIVGAPDKFAVHLTDVTDFAPLRGGAVRFVFTPRHGGESVVVEQNAPRAPGIYGPEPTFRRAGPHDLMIMIQSPQINDTIHVPGLLVYESVTGTPPPDGAADEGIPFLKEQQWKTPGFATAFPRRVTVSSTISAPGEIVPAAARHARISAPVSGLVELSGIDASLAPGVRVSRGQRLAVITPAIGEGGSALAAARRELREAENEFARATRLFAADAIPQRRLHEAETHFAAARETMAGLGMSAVADSSGRLEIRSPLNGVVVEHHLIPGSRVNAGEHLLTVVDPSIVWLSVRVPAAQAASVLRTRGASFALPGREQRYHTNRVLAVGAVLDSISRTIPVLFEVANPEGAVTIGSLVQADVETAERVTGIGILLDAILEEDGRPLVYVQVSGERFERRDVVLGGRDGTHALVVSGLSESDRVVTGAAVQVRLASMSTAVPAHGHEH